MVPSLLFLIILYVSVLYAVLTSVLVKAWIIFHIMDPSLSYFCTVLVVLHDVLYSVLLKAWIIFNLEENLENLENFEEDLILDRRYG